MNCSTDGVVVDAWDRIEHSAVLDRICTAWIRIRRLVVPFCFVGLVPAGLVSVVVQEEELEGREVGGTIGGMCATSRNMS